MIFNMHVPFWKIKNKKLSIIHNTYTYKFPRDVKQIKKLKKKKIWDNRSTVKDLHYCTCLSPIDSYTPSLTLAYTPHSLSHNIPKNPQFTPSTMRPHLGACGLPAASVQPPSPNFSSPQARRSLWFLFYFNYLFIFFIYFLSLILLGS